METEATEIIEDRLTVKEAAKTARVHCVTIRKWMYNGKLRYTKTQTGRVRIKEEDLRSVLSLD